MKASAPMSRRELLSRLFRLGGKTAEAGTAQDGNEPKTAIIQGRFCLAYRNSFCSVCSERCPVPGAIVTERGIPRVVPSACTGCAVCYEVCPAPRKAILMIGTSAQISSSAGMKAFG
jgi:Na+-translocating ferredoxin:NAD+ oxidoreductase RNF subunit RnfB